MCAPAHSNAPSTFPHLPLAHSTPDRNCGPSFAMGHHMQQKHRFLPLISVLALVMAFAACENKPPEPQAPPKMTNDDLDRSVTAKINADPALLAYKLDVDAD